MKKLFLWAALMIAAAFSSCKYDDGDIWNSVYGLESRVAKLEELCKQLNTNISSLQAIVSALQNNDYVTGVAPVTSNGEIIGYTISFTKSAPITIYHGQNGKDGVNGADGKDGHTPIIGVRQDSDSIYYWTLDGDWLLDNAGDKIKAEGRDGQNGADGKPGEPGKDGQDGANGADGKDGQDGITPQLKIENGYWYVSTDNGSTWTNLGKATGENGTDGKDGIDGADGDSFFQSVSQDADNIYFTLANGETIILPKTQRLSVSFSEPGDLLFGYHETKSLLYTITGSANNYIIKAEMLNPDDEYRLHTTSDSATTGIIEISTAVPHPSSNQVIVTVSDGSQTIMSAINISPKPSIENMYVTVPSPGTLYSSLSGYNTYDIKSLKISGNLNAEDFSTINTYLPSLEVLNIKDVHTEDLRVELPLIREIVLPKTLTSIPDNALANCGNIYNTIKNIIVPASVISIGNYAFYKCSLSGVSLHEGIVSIGDYAFSESNLSGKVVLPEGVKSIGNYAFSTTPLSDISLPESLTTIGDRAFEHCGLEGDIILPKGVTTIGEYAFLRCQLTSITLPENLTSLGARSFLNCENLSCIYCKAKTPPTISVKTAPRNNIGIDKCVLYVPRNCKEAYVNSEWNEAKRIEEIDF